MRYTLYALPLFVPAIAFAQDETLQDLFTNFAIVVNTTLIPFLLGIAFLFFVFNAVRYFVIEAGNEQGREQARLLAIYGIAAFVLIIIFWGLVILLVNSLGLGGADQPCPDYGEWIEVDGGCVPA